MADLVEHVVDARDIKVAFLLAGKRGVGKVFGCGRRTHGKRALAIGIETGKCLPDGLLEPGGKRGVGNPLANFGTGPGQLAHIVSVQGIETVVDALIKPGGLEKVAKGLGGGCKPAWNPDAGICQLTDHFTQRSVFAPYRVHIRHAELLERYNIRHDVTFEIEKACLPDTHAGIKARACIPPRDGKPYVSGKPALPVAQVTGNLSRNCTFYMDGLMVQTAMNGSHAERTVFIVSDSTGITAETFSHAVLSQFEEVPFQAVRLPFIDSMEKAGSAARRIARQAAVAGAPPLVFSTLVDSEIADCIREAPCIFLDLFGEFVERLEGILGVKSSRSIGRSHTNGQSKQYNKRIEAINFSLAHDDGQYINGLELADVILIGVSRCGKTPTSLYLAMQYSVKAANYPLIPEDFERNALPSTLLPFRRKLFGLSIQPERLAEVRNERRPDSVYSSLKQCRNEVASAERLMRMENIPWLSTTTRSIEEISTKILDEVGLDRMTY